VEKMEDKLPYNHNYVMSVSIKDAFFLEEHINPAQDSGYSREDWDALSKPKQEKWLYVEAENFKNNNVEFFWE
jgi:hypothetical protein